MPSELVGSSEARAGGTILKSMTGFKRRVTHLINVFGNSLQLVRENEVVGRR